LFAEASDAGEPPSGDSVVTGLLRRWLFLAGYRERTAPAVMVTATLVVFALGLAVVFIIHKAGLAGELLRNLALLPPGVGDLFMPIAYLAPWIMFLMFALWPLLVVRRSRRDRVEKVEQDLPISLELLATLSEAGLGFDAALSRVLDSMHEDRPLSREFRTYQSDLLAGRTRVEALRRLARRLEVSSVTILVSALVQAEQLGTGIAQALRRQADDLRDRRRERANAFAMTLPVKRMFPLVICFMPGIFVWTLGPFFVQLFQFAETFVRVRNF
jgi:tight adherence protein C